MDASGWATAADIHQAIATALDFPDYYGHNLDALNNCLYDVVAREYGIPADATGFVLGQRVLCLVHTADPDLAFEPVGATHVEWNQAEWLRARRRPGATQL